MSRIQILQDSPAQSAPASRAHGLPGWMHDFAFASSRARKGLRPATIAAALVLYALGALHWALFFNFGRMSFQHLDWAKEHIYFTILQQAFTHKAIPWNMGFAMYGTDRFFAIPEVLLSPQAFLLRFMSIGPFVAANIVLLYSLGFLGCVLLARRYHLSNFAFCVLFVLTSFNGYITSHLAVGHTMWNAYFLLPLFFLYLLDICQGYPSWPVPKLGIVLFAIMLQGAFHMLTWCLLFLTLVALFNPRLWKPLFFAAALGVLLSAFRLFPSAYVYRFTHHEFLTGYLNLRDLYDALTALRSFTFPALTVPLRQEVISLDWWEFDAYIGLSAFVFLLVFGVAWCWKRAPGLQEARFRGLDWPTGVMTFLSLGPFYLLLNKLPLPLLGTERISSRFIILPLLLLLILAVIRMQLALARQGAAMKGLLAAGLIETIYELMLHSWEWRLVQIDQKLGFAALAAGVTILPKSDPVYKLWVVGGAAVSMATAVGILAAWLLARRRTQAPN